MGVGKRVRWARLRTLAMTVGILTIIGADYAVLPRHPDLRAFDPGAMAIGRLLGGISRFLSSGNRARQVRSLVICYSPQFGGSLNKPAVAL